TALDRERALRDLRQHDGGIHPLGDPVGKPEPVESGRRHHDGVERARLLEPGGDVAPQLATAEVGTHRRELGPSPHRAGADARAPGAGRPRPRGGGAGSARRRGGGGGPPRSGSAPSPSPDGGADGRSFAECTATSARPSIPACSTSFTNTPVPPMAWIGTSRR